MKKQENQFRKEVTVKRRCIKRFVSKARRLRRKMKKQNYESEKGKVTNESENENESIKRKPCSSLLLL